MTAPGSESGSEIFAPELLSGRVALVTGGGTGLGRATAIELARCGATVTIAGRRASTLETATGGILGGIGGGGGGADGAAGRGWGAGVAAAAREPADARMLIEMVIERRGRLDILVNNA